MKINIKTKYWQNKEQDEWRQQLQQSFQAMMVTLIVLGAHGVYTNDNFETAASLIMLTVPILAAITHQKYKRQENKEKEDDTRRRKKEKPTNTSPEEQKQSKESGSAIQETQSTDKRIL